MPSVAYNWKHHEYLVVWHDTWSFQTRSIEAARVYEWGQVLGEFIVYWNPTRDSAQPSVDCDPVHDRYLVAWVYDAPGNGSDWDLYGRFIPWDGPAPGLIAFPISTWSTHQWNPKVTYGRAVEEFLVVWANEYQAGTLPMYISGRRVKADGSGFPGGTSDLTINHAGQNRVNPDVTYNIVRNEYLVVYDNGADVFGMRLTGNLGHNFGGEFGIAGWPGAEIHPAVAVCGSPNKYLVAWQRMYTSARYGIMGRLVYPDETMDADFVIIDASWTASRTQPAVAGGLANYLVAWEHERDGTAFQDIHGRLVTPHTLFLPLVLRAG